MVAKFDNPGNYTEMSILSTTFTGSNTEIEYNDQHNSSAFHSTSTSQPIWLSFNSSLGTIENSNASRHFADYPDSSGILGIEAIIIVVVVSLIPVSVIACMVFVISFNCLKKRSSLWSTSPVDDHEEGKRGSNRTSKMGIQSIIENENAAERFACENSDEVEYNVRYSNKNAVPMIDTPMSIYPGDIFPSYLDNSKSSLTTPISNNSIITMTMRNNHLIVETEERIPCSLLQAEQMFACNLSGTTSAYIQSELPEYQQNDLLDDLDGFSETHHHLHHHRLHNEHDEYTPCSQERRPLYEPTTSRQADEEDQHIELFHKNILVFPNSCESPLLQPSSRENTIAPSCSYDYCADVYDPSESADTIDSFTSLTTATVDVMTPNDYTDMVAINTGYSQSDLTGSSSSNSGRAQIEYGYGNQCEYISSDNAYNRRRSVPRYENSIGFGEVVNTNSNTTISDSPEIMNSSPFKNSVLSLTDCSSPKFCNSEKSLD